MIDFSQPVYDPTPPQQPSDGDRTNIGLAKQDLDAALALQMASFLLKNQEREGMQNAT